MSRLVFWWRFHRKGHYLHLQLYWCFCCLRFCCWIYQTLVERTLESSIQDFHLVWTGRAAVWEDSWRSKDLMALALDLNSLIGKLYSTPPPSTQCSNFEMITNVQAFFCENTSNGSYSVSNIFDQLENL